MTVPSQTTSTGTVTEIKADFVTGTFSGRSATEDGLVPEWPPSPARLFQALTAAVGSEGTHEEIDTLRALENCPPPEIVAAARAFPRNVGHLRAYGPSRSAFSTWPSKPNDQKVLHGRLQYGQMRYLSNNPFSSSVDHPLKQVSDLADTVVVYRVTGLDEHQSEVLDQIASDVAYLGHSRDVCVVDVQVVDGSQPRELEAGQVLYRPSTRQWGGSDRGLRLRTWSPGLADQLDMDYRISIATPMPAQRPDHLTPWVGYYRSRPRPSDRAPAIPVHFVPNLHPHDWNAVVSTFPGSVPLYLPHRERGAIYGAAINADGGDSAVDAGEVIDEIMQVIPEQTLVELGPERWARKTTRASKTWHTVTPVAGSGNPTVMWAEIATRLMTATSLDHTEITVELDPLPSRDRDPAVSAHRQSGDWLWHARITFDTPVTGPLNIGRDGLSGALTPGGDHD